MVKLFKGGFLLEMTEMELAMLIGSHGNISTIKIVRDRQTKKCKGYAFVEVLTEEDAVKIAAALDGEEMQDRVLTVKVSEEASVKPATSQRFNRQTYPRPAFNKMTHLSDDAFRPKRPQKSP
jgi:RNA recognition motif-containing protein